MMAEQRIAGRYRIEGRLGVGGMSTVMLAFDERLERHVAVKLLAEHLADDPTFVSRFRREALAAARLVHPNIVQVFDFGLDTDTHQHFIVMERVSGCSCAELLRDRGHLDVEQAVDIVSQACVGLDYAHRNGVVHRDVKPGNLLVSDADIVKLADFGIARATDQSSITQVGSVLGTAAYLAPEQARGEEAGPAADLYSLGVVAYQLLSGRLPYEANSLSELALKQQREAPIPLQELNPHVPDALADAVALAISVDRYERPTDAPALAELIADGARGLSPYRGSRTREAETAHTRVLPAGDPATAETRISRPSTRGGATAAPRTPRTVPARRPTPPGNGRGQSGNGARGAAPSGRSGAGGRRAARRALALLLLVCVVVVVAIVVVILVSKGEKTVVHYQRIIGNDAQSAISSVKSLISKYTSK
jgi:eukaryotic-like serine/threonine-protein kinase